MEDDKILSVSKQYEIMYNDLQLTIAERKKTIFDISRWHVTLQCIIIGFAAYNAEKIGKPFIFAPILVGLIGFALYKSVNDELNIHRKTIAELRKNVGGDFYILHKEMVDYFLEGTSPNFNYWARIKDCFFWVIFISSLGSFFTVFMFLF